MTKKHIKTQQIQSSDDALFEEQMEMLRNPVVVTSAADVMAAALESPFCDPETHELMLAPRIVVETPNSKRLGLSFENTTTDEATVPNLALANSLEEWPTVIASLVSHIKHRVTFLCRSGSLQRLNEEKLIRNISKLFVIIQRMDEYMNSPPPTRDTDEEDVVIEFKIPKDFEDMINASDYTYRPEVIVNEGTGHSYGQKSLDKWLERNKRAPASNIELEGRIRRVSNRQLSVVMGICREAEKAILDMQSSDTSEICVAIEVLDKCISAVFSSKTTNTAYEPSSYFFISFHLFMFFSKRIIDPVITSETLTLLCARTIIPSDLPREPIQLSRRQLVSVHVAESLRIFATTSPPDTKSLLVVCSKSAIVYSTMAALLYDSIFDKKGDNQELKDSSIEMLQRCKLLLVIAREFQKSKDASNMDAIIAAFQSTNTLGCSIVQNVIDGNMVEGCKKYVTTAMVLTSTIMENVCRVLRNSDAHDGSHHQFPPLLCRIAQMNRHRVIEIYQHFVFEYLDRIIKLPTSLSHNPSTTTVQCIHKLTKDTLYSLSRKDFTIIHIEIIDVLKMFVSKRFSPSARTEYLKTYLTPGSFRSLTESFA